MAGRLKAYTLLVLAFFKTVLTRWFGWGRRFGLDAFERNYAADGLTAMGDQDGAVLEAAGHCIACGRCNEPAPVDPAPVDPAQNSALREPPDLMLLVLARTRATPDFEQSASAWNEFEDSELARRRSRCPTAVPLVELKHFALRHAAGSAGALSAHDG